MFLQTNVLYKRTLTYTYILSRMALPPPCILRRPSSVVIPKHSNKTHPKFFFLCNFKLLKFTRPLLQIEQLIEFGPFRPFFWSHFQFQKCLLSLMDGLNMPFHTSKQSDFPSHINNFCLIRHIIRANNSLLSILGRNIII